MQCEEDSAAPGVRGGALTVAAGDELLVLDQVNKRFGGLKVIVDFDFVVHEEEIVGLIGPNGAGKSTVFNLITSIYTPDTGSIKFRGQEIAGLAPHKICHLGISRTYQLVRAFLKMTAFENVMTAAVYGGKAPRAGAQGADAGGPRARRALRQGRRRAPSTSRSPTAASSRSPWASPRCRASSCWTSRWPA